MAKSDLILCDTNIILRLFWEDQQVLNELQKIGPANVGLSIITHAEMYYGARKKDFQTTKNFLNSFPMYPLNEEITSIFNGIFLNYSLTHRVRIADTLIAATAIAFNLRVYTDNRKHFDFIPEIRLYNPS